MKVEADVDEADIGQVKEGQKVEFTVDAYINDVFHGEVQQIRLEPTTTNNVVTYTVIIEAPNPDYKLLPGMTASVTIVTEEHSGLAVPVEALNFTPSQKVMESFDKNDARAKNSHATAMMPGKENRDSEMVWVLNEGVMTPRFISTDISDGVYKIVRNGVAEGDSIVLSANFVTKNRKLQGRTPILSCLHLPEEKTTTIKTRVNNGTSYIENRESEANLHGGR